MSMEQQYEIIDSLIFFNICRASDWVHVYQVSII